MPHLEKTVYTAKAYTTGGRDGGWSHTSDGRLAVQLSTPGSGVLASNSVLNADCLIVDVQLPGISGFELQDRLSGGHKRSPILFVSAHGTDVNREHAIRQGAAGFLTKPVRREELLDAIKAAT